MPGRLRYAVAGPASALLVLVMLVGCLTLWIGVPLAWLWVGSQIQASASLGTALMATMAGVIATIIAMVFVLSWINHKHAELREIRQLAQRPEPSSPRAAAVRAGSGASSSRRRHHRHEAEGALEPMLVISAGLAAVLFAIWFFGFAGASPVPLNIGY